LSTSTRYLWLLNDPSSMHSMDAGLTARRRGNSFTTYSATIWPSTPCRQRCKQKKEGCVPGVLSLNTDENNSPVLIFCACWLLYRVTMASPGFQKQVGKLIFKAIMAFSTTGSPISRGCYLSSNNLGLDLFRQSLMPRRCWLHYPSGIKNLIHMINRAPLQ
jgi:hypothetical protein